MDHAGPHLLLMLLRPVDSPGRNGGRQPCRHQTPRCRVGARCQQVQRAGRQTHACGQLHQQQRVAKPHPVQGADPAWPDPPRDTLADGDHAVELAGVFGPRDKAHGAAAARQKLD